MSTNFSPTARERTQYWRVAPTAEEDNEVDPAEPARLVRVRLPGKRSLQEVHEDDRKAKIDSQSAKAGQRPQVAISRPRRARGLQHVLL